jgi:Spy/CpxP family protein refolding chaperone
MKSKALFKAILCSFFVFTIVCSQGSERPHAGPPNGRLIEKLNLTDTQKKDFERLNTDFAKQRVEQQAKIKIAALDLRALMKAESPDKSSIEKKINEIGNLQAQNRMLGVDHWFSVNKMLNPDQQKIWKSALERPLRTRFAARMRQMHDRMMMRSHQRPMPPEGSEE